MLLFKIAFIVLHQKPCQCIVLPLDFPWNVSGGLSLVECSSCGILRSFVSDEKEPTLFRSVQHDWGCRGAQGPALGKPWSAGSPRCQVEVKDRPAGAWPASRNGQGWPGGDMGCACLPPAQPLPCVRPREDILEGLSGRSDATPAVVGLACADGAILFFFLPHCAARGLLDQGRSLHPLQWKLRVLTTAPPGKPQVEPF